MIPRTAESGRATGSIFAHVANAFSDAGGTEMRFPEKRASVRAVGNATAQQERDWPAGLHMVRGLLSVPHVLVDAEGVVLLDTGIPSDAWRIRRVMERAGVGMGDVRAILLTHGHIDHAGSVAQLKQWTGAPVYAHALEQPHIDGKFPYRGLSRVTGMLEAMGRVVGAYRSVKIDVTIAEGDVLPFWGGLRVVHLPGHTMGHC